MEANVILGTGAAALLFAAMFLFGDHIHPLKIVVRDRRTMISFAAGMTAAYVFVHLLPELHGAREKFAEAAGASVELRYEGASIYFLALVGFLAFYGLDHLRATLSEPPDDVQEAKAFRVHVGGFAVYVALMSYLLVHSLEGEGVTTVLYAIAVALHFLGIDHALREEHGARYERTGRYILAGACILGWAIGLLMALPVFVLALLVAFVSGSIIMNSLISELPSEKDGRFVPFLLGGLLYGLVLLPLG
jgi:hypothetical protein